MSGLVGLSFFSFSQISIKLQSVQAEESGCSLGQSSFLRFALIRSLISINVRIIAAIIINAISAFKMLNC